MSTLATLRGRRSLGAASLALLLLLVCGLTGVWAEEEKPARRIAIITHRDNAIGELSKSEIVRMFLKRKTVWENGKRCFPIDQSGDSAIRRIFTELVMDRTVDEMKRYWMQEMMTGNARPPISLRNSVTAKKYVAKLKGSISYVYEDEVDESVKVIRVRDVAELYSGKKDAGKNEEATAPRGDEEEKKSP